MLHRDPRVRREGICFGCDLITVNAKRTVANPTVRQALPPIPRSAGASARSCATIATPRRVEWVDAPADYDRVPLSIEGTLPRGAAARPERLQPVRDGLAEQGRAAPDKRPAKRDLRKLSAWIKQMREIEERKKRGDEDGRGLNLPSVRPLTRRRRQHAQFPQQPPGPAAAGANPQFIQAQHIRVRIGRMSFR